MFWSEPLVSGMAAIKGCLVKHVCFLVLACGVPAFDACLLSALVLLLG